MSREAKAPSRPDFIFTIGYEGDTAIIDGRARARYGRLSTEELAAAGLFRPAFASALHDGGEAEFAKFRTAFNAKAGTRMSTPEEFQRFFGITVERPRRVMVL